MRSVRSVPPSRWRTHASMARSSRGTGMIAGGKRLAEGLSPSDPSTRWGNRFSGWGAARPWTATLGSALPAPARLAAAVLGILVLGATAAPGAAVSNETTAKPPAYLGTPACVECHDAEAVAWAGSHHDWALRSAAPESVLGDFADSALTHFGITSRFYRVTGDISSRPKGGTAGWPSSRSYTPSE